MFLFCSSLRFDNFFSVYFVEGKEIVVSQPLGKKIKTGLNTPVSPLAKKKLVYDSPTPVAGKAALLKNAQFIRPLAMTPPRLTMTPPALSLEYNVDQVFPSFSLGIGVSQSPEKEGVQEIQVEEEKEEEEVKVFRDKKGKAIAVGTEWVPVEPGMSYDEWFPFQVLDLCKEVVFKRPDSTQWSFEDSIFGDPYHDNLTDKVSITLERDFRYSHRSLLSDNVTDMLDDWALWLQDSRVRLEDKAFTCKNSGLWCSHKAIHEVVFKKEFISVEV